MPWVEVQGRVVQGLQRLEQGHRLLQDLQGQLERGPQGQLERGPQGQLERGPQGQQPVAKY